MLTGVFYASMVAAGSCVELLFDLTGMIPDTRDAIVLRTGVSWNYTTWFDIAALVLAFALVLRILRTRGRGMLSHMPGGRDAGRTGRSTDQPPKGRR